MKRSAEALALALLAVLPAQARDSSGPPRRSTVDLLRLIALPKGVVQGEWKFDGRTLVCPPVAFARVEVPYVPPDEYDVRVVLERKGKGNSLNLGLARGERQFILILDGVGMSGMELIDGKGFYGNETTVKGRQVADGARAVVECSVRKGGFAARVDGRTVVDWKGDWSRVSLFPGWKMPRKGTLFVGSYESNTRIEALELLPVKGAGRRVE